MTVVYLDAQGREIDHRGHVITESDKEARRLQEAAFAAMAGYLLWRCGPIAREIPRDRIAHRLTRTVRHAMKNAEAKFRADIACAPKPQREAGA